MAYEGDLDDLAREGEEEDEGLEDVEEEVCVNCRRSVRACVCGSADSGIDDEDEPEEGEAGETEADELEEDEGLCPVCGEPEGQCEC
ncbi:hypothetical protein EPO05_02460 [Patescibacteria group bacterium]|nr:MAG: hypothetical protein EPO05_02460 [Patescibacteria group bacterium]